MEWQVTLIISDPLERSQDYLEGVLDDWLSDEHGGGLEWADLFIVEREVEAR